MLEVILDTETTGLSATEKHRIVEIGCIELDNQIPTNKIFHKNATLLSSVLILCAQPCAFDNVSRQKAELLACKIK